MCKWNQIAAASDRGVLTGYGNDRKCRVELKALFQVGCPCVCVLIDNVYGNIHIFNNVRTLAVAKPIPLRHSLAFPVSLNAMMFSLT